MNRNRGTKLATRRSTGLQRVLRRCRGDSGATSTEYMLIMVFVVLPIAALLPMFLSMIKTYGSRMTFLTGLPFP